MSNQYYFLTEHNDKRHRFHLKLEKHIKGMELTYFHYQEVVLTKTNVHVGLSTEDYTTDIEEFLFAVMNTLEFDDTLFIQRDRSMSDDETVYITPDYFYNLVTSIFIDPLTFIIVVDLLFDKKKSAPLPKSDTVTTKFAKLEELKKKRGMK